MHSYPVAFEVDYAERRSRLTASFRLILAIPLMIWLYVFGIVASARSPSRGSRS